MRWDAESLQRVLVLEGAEQNMILRSAVMALLASEEDDACFGAEFARWRETTVADLRQHREKIVAGLRAGDPQPIWGAGFMFGVAEDRTHKPHLSSLAPLLHQVLREVWDQPTLVDERRLRESLDAYLRRRLVELLREKYEGEAYGSCDPEGNNAFVRVYLPSIAPLLELAAAPIASFGMELLARIYEQQGAA